MALTYIKLYHDFLDEAQPLTDAEVGRLVRAMLSHARGDVLPEAYLTGNERFLFPRWRIQIDRDADAYGRIYEANRRNGALGGPSPQGRPVARAARAEARGNARAPDAGGRARLLRPKPPLPRPGPILSLLPVHRLEGRR